MVPLVPRPCTPSNQLRFVLTYWKTLERMTASWYRLLRKYRPKKNSRMPNSDSDTNLRCTTPTRLIKRATRRTKKGWSPFLLIMPTTSSRNTTMNKPQTWLHQSRRTIWQLTDRLKEKQSPTFILICKTQKNSLQMPPHRSEKYSSSSNIHKKWNRNESGFTSKN